MSSADPGDVSGQPGLGQVNAQVDSSTGSPKNQESTGGAAHFTSVAGNLSPAVNTWTDISHMVGKVFLASIEAGNTVDIEFSNDGTTAIATIPAMTLGRQAHSVAVSKQWQTNFPAKYFKWTQSGTTSTVEMIGYGIALPEDTITAQEVDEAALLLLRGVTTSGYMFAGSAIYDPFVKEVLISAVDSSIDFSCLVERALLNDGAGVGVPQHTGGTTFNVGQGGGLFDKGTSTGGTGNTNIDTAKAWVVNSLVGKWLESGVDRFRITQNTATVITVAGTFTVTPTTTPYLIIGSGVGFSEAEVSLGQWGGAVYIQAQGQMAELTANFWAHRIY